VAGYISALILFSSDIEWYAGGHIPHLIS